MTAIVLPDIDRKTIEELKKRIPDLSEIELPNLPSRKAVGRTADQAIDRLLGRSRAPIWPWIAAGIGLVALVGVVAAWFAWFRRPRWQTQPDPWSGVPSETKHTTETSSVEDVRESMGDVPDSMDAIAVTRRRTAAGRSSSVGAGVGSVSTDSPIGSTPYPIEEA